MSKTTKSKISRNAPDEAEAGSESAGTPTAASAPEVPSPATQAKSKRADKPDAEAVGEPLARPGGASFFIPPQKPSGFGVKEGV